MVETSLWAVWAKQHAPYIGFRPQTKQEGFQVSNPSIRDRVHRKKILDLKKNSFFNFFKLFKKKKKNYKSHFMYLFNAVAKIFKKNI